MRDALTNVVLFSEWATSANPVQGNIHIGKCSSVEATFDHGNLLSWIDATQTGFTALTGPASRLCWFSATTCSSPAWFLSGNQVLQHCEEARPAITAFLEPKLF